MKLSRIIVFTPDVDRLADFYRSAFFLKQKLGGDPTWREMDAGNCSIAFHKIDEDSPVRDGWIKPVFAADDVVAERSRLTSLGISMSEVSHFDGIELSDGTDPDGNTFQISSRPTSKGVSDNEGL